MHRRDAEHYVDPARLATQITPKVKPLRAESGLAERSIY
jgi:hypothetical protein